MKPMPRDVLVAAIIGAHGVKGEVRVKYFTRSSGGLSDYGPPHDAEGRTFTLERAHGGVGGETVAAFREITGRAAAEAMRGVKLYVARDKLPAADSDEYYHADLIGLAAVDRDGRHIGKVTMVHNFGAGDILAVACEGGAEILIAFTRENVPEVDLAGGRIVVAVADETEAGKS
jgi:16S rRNA processing protein RimM